MSETYVHPFYYEPSHDSYAAGSFDKRLTNPLFTLTAIALSRVVKGADLPLPSTFGRKQLRQANQETSKQGFIFGISNSHAHDLAQIGTDILDFDKKGLIQPPLSSDEYNVVSHIVKVVETAEAVALQTAE